MFTVSPSIYSADLLDLRKVLDQAKEFEHIHLDIDDGNFVKGISFGVDLVEQIAAYRGAAFSFRLFKQSAQAGNEGRPGSQPEDTDILHRTL